MKALSKLGKIATLLSACSTLGFCIATGQSAPPAAAPHVDAPRVEADAATARPLADSFKDDVARAVASD